MNEVVVRNRQRAERIDRLELQKRIAVLCSDILEIPRYEIGIHLVSDRIMVRVNETYLRHAGSTDVITFDHGEMIGNEYLYAEIYICVDEAIRQAARYRTPWMQEILRYVVHAFLHLLGFDDGHETDRARMKRREDAVLSRWLSRCPLRQRPGMKAGRK